MSGRYQIGETIFIPFTTRQFSDGVPTILTGSPVITGHRDANLTQFTTGITLAANFDGIAGLNMITVAATTGNSYVAGETYTLYISAGTVGGVSVVGEVVGHFDLDGGITLPGQEAPPLSPTLYEAIGWLYKMMRNKKDNDGTTAQLYADDESTVDAKATVSEAGGTVTEAEWITGP